MGATQGKRKKGKRTSSFSTHPPHFGPGECTFCSAHCLVLLLYFFPFLLVSVFFFDYVMDSLLLIDSRESLKLMVEITFPLIGRPINFYFFFALSLSLSLSPSYINYSY